MAFSSSPVVEEQADVAHEVVAGGCQVVGDLRHVAQNGRDRSSSASRDGGLATSSLSSLSCARRFLSALGRRSRICLELLLQRLDLGLDLAAHGFGQRVEHLGLDHLALVHRRHGEAGRRAQDGDVLALRLAC